MATRTGARSSLHWRFAGVHLLSASELAKVEQKCDARIRGEYEARRIREMDVIEKLRQDAVVLKRAAEEECRRMRADCQRSIREQYEVFDRQWARREAYSGAKVESLKREYEERLAELAATGDRGRKLLTLAIDPRTPEREAVAAFLKARSSGIRLAD